MKKLWNSNSASWRLLRTIIQGVIGVVVANIDLIIQPLQIPGEYKPLIVAFIMAILSPVMKLLGGIGDE